MIPWVLVGVRRVDGLDVVITCLPIVCLLYVVGCSHIYLSGEEIRYVLLHSVVRRGLIGNLATVAD